MYKIDVNIEESECACLFFVFYLILFDEEISDIRRILALTGTLCLLPIAFILDFPYWLSKCKF